MNPRRIALVFAALVLFITGIQQSASAATELFAGATVPVREFSFDRKMGPFVGCQYTYDVISMVGVGAMGAYHRLSPPAHLVNYSNLVEALAIAKIHPPVGVFLQGGVGVIYSSIGFKGRGESKTDFTSAGGLGVSFMQIEITALYHSVWEGGGSRAFVTASVGTSF